MQSESPYRTPRATLGPVEPAFRIRAVIDGLATLWLCIFLVFSVFVAVPVSAIRWVVPLLGIAACGACVVGGFVAARAVGRHRTLHAAMVGCISALAFWMPLLLIAPRYAAAYPDRFATLCAVATGAPIALALVGAWIARRRDA